jgi:GT2 family glycosyltransferase
MEAGLVSVNVLVRNHRQYLYRCLECLLNQTYPNIEILVMDNDSTDDSIKLVEECFSNMRVVRNDDNIGYSGGHNKAIRLTRGEYFVALNPDVFLTPTFIERKVQAAKREPRIGMVEGKLLKVRFENDTPVETGQLDSTGLVLRKNRKNYERGHGEPNNGRYNSEEPVFGAFGAAPMYKRAMLEDLRIDDEYFDADFFAYREEVDLAWRAQLRKWKCLYVPDAVAHHVHSYSPETRKSQPRHLRRLQFRNRYLMMLKNDLPSDMLRHAPHIMGFEMLALGYVLLCEPHLLLAYGDVIRLFAKMVRKRRIIQSRRLVPDDHMLQWFI